MKRFVTQTVLAAGLIGAASVSWLAFQNRRFVPLDHLPESNATLLSIDFAALRHGGVLSLLAGNPATQEPDYLSFISATGFDYQKDLNFALIAFAPEATYFLINGNFEWDKLEKFAQAGKGTCFEKLCSLPGSIPDRRVSFLPLRKDWMALAVSSDDLAAARLRETKPGHRVDVPKDPIWALIPASALKRNAEFSSGTRLIASVVGGSDQIVISLGPSGAGYAAHLETICASAKDAQATVAALSRMTTSLKGMAPNHKRPDDMLALLVAGTFHQADRKVSGYWPIPKAFLDNLVHGL